jgi:hypothetical protein
MNEYGNFIRRVDIITNLLDRKKLAEQTKKPNRSLQEANKRRWLQYQEILRAELTAKIAAANASGGSISTVSDADAQAFITAAGITNSTQQNAVNQLVLDFKSYNLWDLMNAIYPFVGGTATTHKYNLKDPRDLNAAYRIGFSGGWTHDLNGALGNAINTIADTYYTGFGVGEIGLYSRNTSNHFGGQNNAFANDSLYYLPSIYVTGEINNTVSYFSDGSDLSGINSIFSGTSPTGLVSVSGNDIISKLYKNGILIGSVAPSLAPSSLSGNIFLGGINFFGYNNTPLYTNTGIAFGFITTTVLNDTQNVNLYTSVQTFQTTLGRQV